MIGRRAATPGARAVGGERAPARLQRVALALLLVLAGGTPSAATEPATKPATEPAPERILGDAFANRYALDFTADITLILHAEGREIRRRTLHAATLEQDGDFKALGRVSAPDYLRGMTLLTLSAPDGAHQAFVYLPTLGRVKRIALTHRDDAFLGSDLTYEDFERRRVSDCALARLPDGTREDEPVFRVECRPTAKLRYDRAVFEIAKRDHAILAITEYRDGRDAPTRRMTAPRAGMRELAGHVLATRLTFENLLRDTATKVEFENLEAEALPERLFTAGAIEREAGVRQALE